LLIALSAAEATSSLKEVLHGVALCLPQWLKWNEGSYWDGSVKTLRGTCAWRAINIYWVINLDIERIQEKKTANQEPKIIDVSKRM
jgi:hypothetical protein